MGRGLRDEVRLRYSAAARAVGGSSCCGGVAEAHYSTAEWGEVPREAGLASLGCGNPVAMAELLPGEVVLDLGSGGGIDVLLSARRVSPGGRVYGLDMTDEMLELARRNAAEAGAENVEFLKGEIEDVPLPDASVDVVMSNCVINLSTDKARVFAETFRVLRPGGRLAVYDVVFPDGSPPLPAGLRHDPGLWAGCVAGALEAGEYRRLLAAAGFEGVSVEITHRFAGRGDCCGSSGLPPVASAFIRARKPAGG
ncbi:Arsenite methyltransferase [Rubrobacter xylanophilus DSM 9941]|uniref:arsenite methyltransferase n=1 Tax=Rubrobacter xylanophilus TaxID=49319 RepID=UPI001C63DB81|nr:arsenite methyltransferase [Rubrobacter xylanophilus]QYJ15913.1 Arsenite methyltransferase [Rubrobacter xylanophilus DSM 9941]